MFGQTNEIPVIPSETKRAARAVFNRKNFYILVGEQLDFILKDIQQERLADFSNISRTGGAILPLTTFFQFIEGLTDEQAIDAIRTRIDWKYALHLPVNTLSLQRTALCKFRQTILGDLESQREFQKLVDALIKLNPPGYHTHTDFEVLALLSSVCSTNVMNWSWEAMSAALSVLASRHPEWLLQVAQPHWYGRFNRLPLSTHPTLSVSQQELSMERLGADIRHLLEEVQRSKSPEIKDLTEIKTLHHLWERYFEKKRVVVPAQGGTLVRINCDSCTYGAR